MITPVFHLSKTGGILSASTDGWNIVVLKILDKEVDYVKFSNTYNVSINRPLKLLI